MTRGILTDIESGDLLVEAGALAVGDTDSQVAEMVLRAEPGEFREFPRLGAAAMQMLGGRVDVMWPATVHRMLKAAGVEVTSVSVAEDGTITIS